MISRKLRAAINAFRAKYGKYSTQEGALYQCCDATDEFIHFVTLNLPDLANELGLRRFEFDIDESPSVYPAVYKQGKNESGHLRAPWHCIVDTKNVLIDWTARQYMADAPYPLIIVKRQLDINKISADYYKARRKTGLKKAAASA